MSISVSYTHLDVYKRQDLKPVYKAPIEEVDFAALDEFETKWGEKYPLGVKSWRCQLD